MRRSSDAAAAAARRAMRGDADNEGLENVNVGVVGCAAIRQARMLVGGSGMGYGGAS